MNTKEASPEEYSKFLDELVAEVKTMLKPGTFSDEQVLQTCKEVTEKVTEIELLALVDQQSRLCDRCATCCRLCSPIDMTDKELNTIMNRLGMKSNKFLKKFKITWSGDSNLYHMQAGPCPFLKEPNICTIYDIRPAACSGFPAQPMLSDVIDKNRSGGKIDLLPYCHVVKSWSAYRAAAALMRTNPKMQEFAKAFEPIMQKFQAQIDRTSDPTERLKLQYQLRRTLDKLLEEGFTKSQSTTKPDDAD